MQCSQCQTELPDSATICPQCGTANEQPSQPVMFSYLPAGTPPWPITVPQRPSYTSEPVAAVPASLSKSQETKPRRSLRSILLAITVLVLVPILGVAFTLSNLYFNGDLFPKHTAAHKTLTNQTQSTPQASASPTAQGNALPAPASFKKTRSTDVNVSLQYPSDWLLQPNNDSNSHAIDLAPSQQIPVGVVIARFSDALSASITSPDEVNQGRMAAVGQNGTNVQNIQPTNPQPTIAGVQWKETEETYTDSNGDKVHLASISVQRNKVYYNILVLSLDEIYVEATQKYIQPILSSVQFLS